MTSKVANRQDILLVEDDLPDVELTLATLEKNSFAHKITVVNDGEEALDYLYRRGKFKTRAVENPSLVLLDNQMPERCSGGCSRRNGLPLRAYLRRRNRWDGFIQQC